MMKQLEERAGLMAAVPADWSIRKTAHTLGRCIASAADAKVMIAVAYAHARGWLTHLAVPALEWEGIYAGLDGWDDATGLGEVVTRLEGIRDQLKAFVNTGGVRETKGAGAKIDLVVKHTVVIYLTAAVFHAVKRRIRALAGVEVAA